MSKKYSNLGVSGLNRGGGYVYEEFLPELRYPRAARIYKEMSDNDPVVGAILFLCEMMIRGAKWRVKPASDLAADKEYAKFIEECMHDMDSSWASFITEVIAMFTYGFDFHEITYKIRRGPHSTSAKYRSKYDDGKIGWKDFGTRAQSTLKEWEFDEEGNVTAFIQWAPPDFKVVRIPINKGMLFRTRVHKNNPEGKSLLRNAYRPWYFKKRIEEIEAIGVERDLAGLPVLTAPENVDIFDDTDPDMVKLRTVAEGIVEGVRNDATSGVLLSNGWEFKLASTGGSRQFDTNAIITRYDYRIAMAILADIVIMGSESNGSYALADIKYNMLSEALESLLFNIADVINKQAVEPLCCLNGMHSKNGYPVIEPTHVKKPSVKEVALILRTANLDINHDLKFHNFVRDICGLEALTEEDFKKMYTDRADKENIQNTHNKAQGIEDPKVTTQNNNKYEDTVSNDFKMSDGHYTGGAN